MSRSELDWAELSEAWQAPEGPPPLPTINAELRKRRWLTSLVVLGELGVTAGVVGVTLWLAGEATIGPDFVFLSGLWIFWLVATVFAWTTRWGQQPLSVADTEEFLRRSVERARRKKRVAIFSLGLAAAQVAFAVSLSLVATDSAGRLRSLLLVLVPLVLGHLLWARWYYERADREQFHFTTLIGAFDAERRR